MTNIWVVSPAFGRFAVTRLVLAQRQRLCRELAERGADARMLIVADDDNLDIAREFGAETLEHPNAPLGGKCNAGLAHAANEGADYIVWVGSDDWLHADVFTPLFDGTAPAQGAILAGHRIAAVDLPGGRLRRCSSPSKYGAIPWIIPADMIRRAKLAPIRPLTSRGLDGTLVRGLRKARVEFGWHHHDPHDLRCVDFKSSTNINGFDRLVKHLSIAGDEDPWAALREHYAPDLVNLAEQTHIALKGA